MLRINRQLYFIIVMHVLEVICLVPVAVLIERRQGRSNVGVGGSSPRGGLESILNNGSSLWWEDFFQAGWTGTAEIGSKVLVPPT